MRADKTALRRRVVMMDYCVGTERIYYYRVESSLDGSRWFDRINFAQTAQVIQHWLGLIGSGCMAVTQFDPGVVRPEGATSKWTYEVIVNGFSFKPGSAGVYKRSGEARAAQRADVALARKQHKLTELIDKSSDMP